MLLGLEIRYSWGMVRKAHDMPEREFRKRTGDEDFDAFCTWLGMTPSDFAQFCRDKLVRAFSVVTSSGEYTRPIDVRYVKGSKWDVGVSDVWFVIRYGANDLTRSERADICKIFFRDENIRAFLSPSFSSIEKMFRKVGLKCVIEFVAKDTLEIVDLTDVSYLV